MRPEAIVKEELRGLEKAAHGGEVWRYFERDFIDFSSNVNPLGPSPEALKAVTEAHWKCAHYPDPDSLALKEAIAAYVGVEEEHLTVGNGSTELIKNFSEAFLRRGEKVAILGPTFSEYEVFSRLYGAEVHFRFPDREKDFDFDAVDLPKPLRAVFLCYPNNPTGRAMDRKRLEELLGEVEERDAFLFLDEAYIEFTDLESLCRRATEGEGLFVLRSLTKFFSLPGLRIGFGVGGRKVTAYLERLRVPWNVNCLAQAAAIASMKDAEYIQEARNFLRREREFFYRRMRGLGLETLPSEANFFLTEVGKAGATAPEIKRRLIERGILIRDCSTFTGLDASYMRTSVRTREENERLFEELGPLLEGSG
jgi:threonine-phosphate decarboxylase